MADPLSTDLDLATRLSNWGTADWTRLMNRSDLMRISEDCVKALDEIQRLERELVEARRQRDQLVRQSAAARGVYVDEFPDTRRAPNNIGE